MARSQKQIDRENAEKAAAQKGGRSQKQIDKEKDAASKIVKIGDKEFPLVKDISVKYHEGPLGSGKTNGEKVCLVLTAKKQDSIMSTKACKNDVDGVYDDIFGGIEWYNEAEIKISCSQDKKDFCDSFNKDLPSKYKNIVLNKNIEACVAINMKKYMDEVFIEGIKICITSESFGGKLSDAVTAYGKENVVFTCINNQSGKDICSELIGQYSDLKVNFVDHFDY